jgi:hypothetical protein
MASAEALDQRRFQSIVTALYAVGAITLVILSVAAADGHLVYSLDDPYIHLALAESIASGGHGVNAGEFASPSSSVIFPLIMAVTTLAGLGDRGPLVVNLVACGVAMWVLAGFVFRHAGGAVSPVRFWLLVLTAPLVMLAVNALGLPMMGMEHGLHVLVAIAVVAGLADMAETGRTTPALLAAIVVCALIRFEGLALALAAIAALAAERHFREAAATLGAIVAALSVYALAMGAMGLPLLPSSVLVKSGASAALVDGQGGALVGQMRRSFTLALRDRMGMRLAAGGLIVIAGLIAKCWLPAGPSRRGAVVVGAVALAAIVAHLLLGQYQQSRYEVYAIAVMIMAVVYLAAPLLRRAGAPGIAALALLAGLVGLPYVSTVQRTPAASRNIYEQQYQMHRFATQFFPAPVAVNDLGWVAYRNDGYVLDLWGLGSEEVRTLTRREGRTAETVGRLAAAHSIAYAMVYDEWFADAIPPHWCRVATLHTSRVTAGSAEVAIYAVDPQRTAALLAALAAFGPTLPAGARLDLAPVAIAAPGEVAEGCENGADALQSSPG